MEQLFIACRYRKGGCTLSFNWGN